MLWEDEAFPRRQLAALIASKVMLLARRKLSAIFFIFIMRNCCCNLTPVLKAGESSLTSFVLKSVCANFPTSDFHLTMNVCFIQHVAHSHSLSLSLFIAPLYFSFRFTTTLARWTTRSPTPSTPARSLTSTQSRSTPRPFWVRAL